MSDTQTKDIPDNYKLDLIGKYTNDIITKAPSSTELSKKTQPKYVMQTPELVLYYFAESIDNTTLLSLPQFAYCNRVATQVEQPMAELESIDIHNKIIVDFMGKPDRYVFHDIDTFEKKYLYVDKIRHDNTLTDISSEKLMEHITDSKIHDKLYYYLFTEIQKRMKSGKDDVLDENVNKYNIIMIDRILTERLNFYRNTEFNDSPKVSKLDISNRLECKSDFYLSLLGLSSTDVSIDWNKIQEFIDSIAKMKFTTTSPSQIFENTNEDSLNPEAKPSHPEAKPSQPEFDKITSVIIDDELIRQHIYENVSNYFDNPHATINGILAHVHKCVKHSGDKSAEIRGNPNTHSNLGTATDAANSSEFISDDYAWRVVHTYLSVIRYFLFTSEIRRVNIPLFVLRHTDSRVIRDMKTVNATIRIENFEESTEYSGDETKEIVENRPASVRKRPASGRTTQRGGFREGKCKNKTFRNIQGLADENVKYSACVAEERSQSARETKSLMRIGGKPTENHTSIKIHFEKIQTDSTKSKNSYFMCIETAFNGIGITLKSKTMREYLSLLPKYEIDKANIKAIDKKKHITSASNYAVDIWSMAHLELNYSFKTIICKKDENHPKATPTYTITSTGPTPWYTPHYYIIVEYESKKHFNMIVMNNSPIFTFDTLPSIIKHAVHDTYRNTQTPTASPLSPTGDKSPRIPDNVVLPLRTRNTSQFTSHFIDYVHPAV